MKALVVQHQPVLKATLQQGTTMIWADNTGKLWAQPHRGAAVQINIVPAAGTNGQVLTIVNGVPAWA